MSSYSKARKRVKKSFNNLMRSFQELFYYGSEVDRWLPEVILLPYISLQWRLDPTWYRIIAPPGSGKSRHLRLLEDYELTHSIDNFTPKSFVSGFRSNGEDPSKLALLDGKVLLVSDESTFMEQRQEDRNTIQSILRRAYDGRFSKGFGNIKEVQNYEFHFNLIIASTPQIDRYFMYNQALGERYINYRLQVPFREKIAERAYYNQFHDFEGRFKRLKRKTHRFLDMLPEASINEVKIDDDTKHLFLNCANFVALIRTHITRDTTGRQVTTLPQAESAGRLVQQMTQTAIASAILHGDSRVRLEHAERAVYFGIGSITAVSSFILHNIYQHTKGIGVGKDASWFSVQFMTLRTALSRSTIQRTLEDLAIHRVLDIRAGKQKGGRLIEYTLSKEAAEIIDDIELFKYYTPPIKRILQFKRLDRTRPIGNVSSFKRKKRKRKHPVPQ